MRQFGWLILLFVLLLPFVVVVLAVADDVNVTSTDGLTRTVTAAVTGPTGPAGAAGAAGPAFTGGTLTTPVLGTAADNCAAIPYSFTADATTGFCSSAASTLNFYTANNNRLGLTNTAATFTVPVLASNGSLTAPTYSFASAAFDGSYWEAGGFGGLRIRSDGPYFILTLDPGHDSTAPLSSLGFHTSTGTQLLNQATATKYAALLVKGSDPSNLLSVTSGAALNQITQTLTATTFSQQIALTGLPALSGCTTKALTDAAAAVSFARVAVATNGYMAGEFEWTATSTDAADQIVTFGKQPIVGVDKAGTVTCATSAQYATTTATTNANTLVCTVTVVTSTTNCDGQVTCTNNTAGDQAINFCWRFEQPIATTVVVP